MAPLSPAATAEAVNKAYANPSNPPPFPKTGPAASDDYFKDAVFIGDSIMDDVEMFNLFPTANFVTKVGISPLSAPRKEFRYKGSREYESMYDVVAKYPHRKIYIMLGSNSLDNKRSDLAFADYQTMMETFLERFSDSIIYLIAPPSQTKHKLEELKIPPKRYANFRDLLVAFAQERQCYVIDYYSVVLTEQGYLPGKYDCGDGIHPNYEGLRLFEEAVRTHTVSPVIQFTFAK